MQASLEQRFNGPIPKHLQGTQEAIFDLEWKINMLRRNCEVNRLGALEAIEAIKKWGFKPVHLNRLGEYVANYIASFTELHELECHNIKQAAE